MKASLTFAAITALLAIGHTLYDPIGVLVFDGPQPQAPQDVSFFVVGVDDLVTSPAISIDQGVEDWESLGAIRRTETFTLTAMLVTYDGGSDLAPCRAAAESNLELLVHALRPPPFGTGDAMLGGVLNQGGASTGWCGLTVTRMTQSQRQAGVNVAVHLALNCTAYV